MSVRFLSDVALEGILNDCQMMGEKKRLSTLSVIHEMAIREALGDDADDFIAKEKAVKQAQKRLEPMKKAAMEDLEYYRNEVAQTYQREFPDLEITDEELARSGEVALVKTIVQKLPNVASLTIESKAERILDVSEEQEKVLVKAIIEGLGIDAFKVLKIDEKAYLEADAQKLKAMIDSGVQPTCSEGIRIEKGTRVKTYRQL